MRLKGVAIFIMSASIMYGAENSVDYSKIERKDVVETNTWHCIVTGKQIGRAHV